MSLYKSAIRKFVARKPLAWSVAALALALAGRGQAADKLSFGPPEAWVKPVPLAPLNKALADAPFQPLLYVNQSHFGADGDSEYIEYAVHIQTPAGLQGMQPTAVWNPDTDTVTFHKVQIVRGDQVIDLLKTVNFTVVRRETNLERSMLDGALTAVMQPEGLQVGDTLVYAMTIRHQDPVLKGHSQDVVAVAGTVPIAHTELRATWDGGKPVRWRESDDLPAAKLTKSAAGGEFTLELDHFQRADPPVDAPARYAALGEVEFTQFTGWDEVSSLLTPLYDKASTLAPDSPLKAEAAKIRATSADPKVQAAAALHLVQDQVRYLFLGMNLGGYIPADADTTWTRRFGDCKGKTALLLALLHELGIKAEPALISTTHADGLNQHLPMLEWFDHVLVRADIGGKVYWLDGTRLGDRDLDSLAVPNFGFALPVQASGGGLEPLKPAPLDRPSQDLAVTLDASAGLDVPAKAHLESLVSGDEAIMVHQGLDSLTNEARTKALRDYWAKDYSWITVQKVAASFDKATGVEKLTMDGAANMEWVWDDATRTWRYETDGTRIGWGVDNRREPGPHADAPYVILYPFYYHGHEDIVLPKKGKGFAVEGDAVDKTLGGAVFKRTLGIHDGVLHIDVSKRALVPEISAAENDAAKPVLTAMYNKAVFLVAPEGYKAGAGETAKLAGDTSRSAADLVNEAGELGRQGKDEQALSRYNQALQLDPLDARALYGRAQVFYKRKAYAAALADAQQALKSDPSLWQAYDLIAAVDADQDKLDDAIDAYTKAIAVYPNDTFALSRRALLHGRRHEMDKARADAEAVLQIDPGESSAIGVLAGVAMDAKKHDDAVALVRKAIDANPDKADLYIVMASVDEDCEGLTQDACKTSKLDAVSQYDKAIAIAPMGYYYLLRAEARPIADSQARLDDFALAIKAAPNSPAAYLARGRQYLYGKDNDKALADANKAIELDPKSGDGYALRQQVYFAQGKTDLALADLDSMSAAHPDNGTYLNNICWQRATHNVTLDKALAECDAAVKIAPKAAAFIDSHGFVELRLGHYDQAIADYDAALALAPNLADSLFGRGIARLRKGLTREGQADLEAARKVWPKIDDIWAGYGVKP
jgi:tetratricopeptide (TPR) repeat protein